MTTHALSLRNKVVACYNAGNISIRKVAERFMVNKKTVNQWLKRYREQGNVEPKKASSTRKSQLDVYREEVHKMVEAHPDFTLAEYCEYCDEKTGVRLSESAMCRFLKKENLSRKKKRSSRVKPEQKFSKKNDWSIGSKSGRSSRKT
jgi:putative transposase